MQMEYKSTLTVSCPESTEEDRRIIERLLVQAGFAERFHIEVSEHDISDLTMIENVAVYAAECGIHASEEIIEQVAKEMQNRDWGDLNDDILNRLEELVGQSQPE